MSGNAAEESNEESDDDFDLEDKRDRRAIDEEDDEVFLQELDELVREVKKDRENVRRGYVNHQFSAVCQKSSLHCEIHIDKCAF